MIAVPPGDHGRDGEGPSGVPGRKTAGGLAWVGAGLEPRVFEVAIGRDIHRTRSAERTPERNIKNVDIYPCLGREQSGALQVRVTLDQSRGIKHCRSQQYAASG